jgi:hypothetical protein
MDFSNQCETRQASAHWNDANARDHRLIVENLQVLAAYAWLNYQRHGKGAVVIDTTRVETWEQPSGNLVFTTTLGYVTEKQARTQAFRLPTEMGALIRAYRPEVEIVVTIARVIESRDYLGHYRLATHPAPPELYREIGPSIVAAEN